MKVSNEAQINVKTDSQAAMKKYEKEIQQLKKELAYQNLNADKKVEKLTPEQKTVQYKLAKKYLKEKEGKNDLQIDSLAHAQLLFQQFRKAHRSICKTMKNRLKLKHMTSLGSGIGVGSTEGEEISMIHKKVRKSKSSSKRSSIVKLMAEDDKRSFYVCSLNRMNDFEKNEYFSQSTFEESNMENKNKTFDSGKQSPLHHDELHSFKNLVQKALGATSLNSIQVKNIKELSINF